jgi:hypothetical protein
MSLISWKSEQHYLEGEALACPDRKYRAVKLPWQDVATVYLPGSHKTSEDLHTAKAECEQCEADLLADQAELDARWNARKTYLAEAGFIQLNNPANRETV